MRNMFSKAGRRAPRLGPVTDAHISDRTAKALTRRGLRVRSVLYLDAGDHRGIH